MRKTVITVMGKDTVGIIAKVSAVCAEKNVNIIDISQSVMQDLFVMVMLTDTENLSERFTDFCARMDTLGKEIGVEIRVMQEEIFNSMHRI